MRSGHANLLCIVPILVYVLPKLVKIVIQKLFSQTFLRGNDSLIFPVKVGVQKQKCQIKKQRFVKKIIISYKSPIIIGLCAGTLTYIDIG